MILRIIKYLIIAFLGFILVSCAMTYGDKITSSITRFSNDTCNRRANNIPLYFDNEKINFEYEKIGLVEAEGNESSSNETVFNHLKYEAWRNCANAIVNIKISYKDRETGVFFTDKETRRNYSSTVLTGLAVRIKNDSLKLPTDTSFINKVRADYIDMNRQTSNQKIGSLIGAVVGLFLVICLLSNQ